jgi:hypothetical protein
MRRTNAPSAARHGPSAERTEPALLVTCAAHQTASPASHAGHCATRSPRSRAMTCAKKTKSPAPPLKRSALQPNLRADAQKNYCPDREARMRTPRNDRKPLRRECTADAPAGRATTADRPSISSQTHHTWSTSRSMPRRRTARIPAALRRRPQRARKRMIPATGGLLYCGDTPRINSLSCATYVEDFAPFALGTTAISR